ncbi:hypothetical protein BC827DRAFT_1201484 [Russula dissimulans]|nr:hypothetical protein BC827DRAFT_1201484 [Russula dissimulans]
MAVMNVLVALTGGVINPSTTLAQDSLRQCRDLWDRCRRSTMTGHNKSRCPPPRWDAWFHNRAYESEDALTVFGRDLRPNTPIYGRTTK